VVVAVVLTVVVTTAVVDTVPAASAVKGVTVKGVTAKGGYKGFGDPQAVTIEGYSGSAMEPFISRDGQYLLFNTSNQAPDIPALQYATTVNAQTFTSQGAIQGANEPGVLSGTPTMDDTGDLYFISTRSYAQTLSTVYTGQFASGQVTDVHLVPGVSAPAAGIVDFDVEVSADGSTLYVSVGQFDGGSGPQSAHLTIFDNEGGTFVADPASGHILHAVNQKKSLTYAASVSTDGLELFFTRARAPGGDPAIYRATRTHIGRPFGHVQRVTAITGFAEAPSLSADGSTLYYHLLVGTQFDIESVTRSPTPWPPARRRRPRGDIGVKDTK
jgi:Tol biopolymer transport system component